MLSTVKVGQAQNAQSADGAEKSAAGKKDPTGIVEYGVH
jgi:hypothetical protein